MDKKVTLKTIADYLQLSTHTVSKALRGLSGMSEVTRKQVIDTAREMGYRTKEQEAGLAAENLLWTYATPRRFVILISGDSSFHQLQLQGAQLRLNELGHSLYPLIIPTELQGKKAFEKWLHQNDLCFVDGLFLTAALPEWMELLLLQLTMPKVLINYPPPLAEVDSVIWDIELAIYRSVKELYEQGHRHILFVVDAVQPRSYELRWAAFVKATQIFGLNSLNHQELHVIGNGLHHIEWMASLKEKLRAGSYTAVISTVSGTVDVIYVVAELMALRIPEDLSIIGLENEQHPIYTQLSRPYLLIKEVGERAAELMVRRLANPTLPFEHVRLAGGFFSGDSIRNLNEPML